jgi:enamine deaminase RidA (YjgF/YER057c/UK114 family)
LTQNIFIYTNLKEFQLINRTEAFLSIKVSSEYFRNERSGTVNDYIPSGFHVVRRMIYSGNNQEELFEFLGINTDRMDDNQAAGFLDCRDSGQDESYFLFHLVKDTSVVTDNLFKDRKVVLISGEDGDFLYLSNIWSRKKPSDPVVNEKQVFKNIKGSLKDFRMDYTSIYRTWFFVDNILSWYGDFNWTRTLYYESKGIYPGEYPASTGIGVSNNFNTPLYTYVNAVKNFQGTIRPVQSGEQCKATDYGSSFSRGIVLIHEQYKRLFLSGTASIDTEGKSIFKDDVKAQTHQTLKVINALMEAEEMNWEDAVSGIIYIKDFKDYATVMDALQEEISLNFPYAVCGSDICRDELLFEMEVELFKNI